MGRKNTVPANETKSKTPLVDGMINKAAEEVAKEEWPGLRETEISEADVRKVKQALKKGKATR